MIWHNSRVSYRCIGVFGVHRRLKIPFFLIGVVPWKRSTSSRLNDRACAVIPIVVVETFAGDLDRHLDVRCQRVGGGPLDALHPRVGVGIVAHVPPARIDAQRAAESVAPSRHGWHDANPARFGTVRK